MVKEWYGIYANAKSALKDCIINLTNEQRMLSELRSKLNSNDFSITRNLTSRKRKF